MVDSVTPVELPPGLDRLPPTEDELPYEDDWMPESNIHWLNPVLLMDALRRFFAGVREAFIGANLFVYFSPDQVKTHDYRGPDFFVVLDRPQTLRKSWVVWEQDGRTPDVVIEMLSASTRSVDIGEKLLVYQNQLRVPEYFWYDPWTYELGGVRLEQGVYQPIAAEADGALVSEMLGLRLVTWEGTYQGHTSRYLRWAGMDGVLLPTAEEAEALAATAAERERQHVLELEARLRRYQDQFGDLPQ